MLAKLKEIIEQMSDTDYIKLTFQSGKNVSVSRKEISFSDTILIIKEGNSEIYTTYDKLESVTTYFS